MADGQKTEDQQAEDELVAYLQRQAQGILVLSSINTTLREMSGKIADTEKAKGYYGPASKFMDPEVMEKFRQACEVFGEASADLAHSISAATVEWLESIGAGSDFDDEEKS